MYKQPITGEIMGGDPHDRGPGSWVHINPIHPVAVKQEEPPPTGNNDPSSSKPAIFGPYPLGNTEAPFPYMQNLVIAIAAGLALWFITKGKATG